MKYSFQPFYEFILDSWVMSLLFFVYSGLAIIACSLYLVGFR